MKLEEKTLREIIDEKLWWSDFAEEPSDAKHLRDIAEDPEALAKIRFLNQQEEGRLLDESSLLRLDFYEVEFTELARLAVAEGTYEADDSLRGKEVDYLKDYSGLKLLIQDMGDIFALYLKDYEFGYIKPLGMCIYEYPASNELLEAEEPNREKFIKQHILPEIELDLWEDDFDLKQELFDYYHNIPDTGNRFIQQRVDLEGLLTVKEAAERLGISDARIKKMVADKLLDGYKLGNKLLVAESSVSERVAYIEKHGKPTRNKEKVDRADEYRRRLKRNGQ